MVDMKDLVDQFNNGDLDVERYFGDFEVFFNLLKKRGLMGDLDPVNGMESDSWQNKYLLWVYDNDKPKYYYWIEKILSDIEVKDGRVYWIGEVGDLADLFCNDRDMSPNTIKSILIGDDVFEPFWDTTDNVNRDVIQELNRENLSVFKTRTLEKLKDISLHPETDLMEEIAKEQGHEEYWNLTPENIDLIFEDDESIESLLKDELEEFAGELGRIHSYSYNSAYESYVYNQIWKELDEYFDTDEKKWISIKHPYKENTFIEKMEIPISDFEGIINNVLEENKKYRESILGYHGSFLTLLRDEVQCLSFYNRDYPDSHEVDKNINIYFSDYF